MLNYIIGRTLANSTVLVELPRLEFYVLYELLELEVEFVSYVSFVPFPPLLKISKKTLS
jgi:hypothetical protein